MSTALKAVKPSTKAAVNAESIVADGASVEIIDLTPSIAHDFLQTIDEMPVEKRQRQMRAANVDALAGAMSSGQWMFNGESIVISTEGFLIDGQHRCRAVIKAGVSVPTVIVRGASVNTLDIIDQGRSRTAIDALVMAGMPHNLAVPLAYAGKIDLAVRVSKGNPMSSGTGSVNIYKNALITPRKIREHVEQHVDLIDSAEWAIKIDSSDIGFSAGINTFLDYRFAMLHPERSRDWLTAFATGSCGHGSLRQQLRTALANEMLAKKKASRADRIAWVIAAWRSDMGDQNRSLTACLKAAPVTQFDFLRRGHKSSVGKAAQ